MLDNVDNPKIPQNHDQASYDIRPYFSQAPHGSLIVTTRWSSLEIGKLVEVKKLQDTTDQQPSLSILTEKSGRNSLKDGKMLSPLPGTKSADLVNQTLTYGIWSKSLMGCH